MELSISKKQKKIYNISENEWLSIQRLLEHNYAFKEINEILHLEIEEEHLIDNYWITLSRGKYPTLLAKYAKVLPLAQSIEVARLVYYTKDSLFKKLIKQSIYPIFLILMSFVLLFIFTTIIMPQMIAMIDTNMTWLPLLLNVLTVSLYIVMLIILALVVISINMFTTRKTSKLVSKLISLGVVNQYRTFELLVAIKQFATFELNTFDTFNYLESIFEGTITGKLVNELKNTFKQGIPIDKAIVDSTMSKLGKELFILGLKSNEIIFFIDLYMKQQAEQWGNLVKKLNLRLQIFAYSMVGLIVFFVYQIMLMPLDMLQTF